MTSFQTSTAKRMIAFDPVEPALDGVVSIMS